MCVVQFLVANNACVKNKFQNEMMEEENQNLLFKLVRLILIMYKNDIF